MQETTHIDQDPIGREVFPAELRKLPGRYNVRGDGPKYWDWEEKASAYLKANGYTVGNWFTGDGDDAGPLSRAVRATKGDKVFVFWYG